MSQIGKVMRMKRFNVVDPQGKIRFLFETSTGTKLELRLTNCSLTGLSGIYAGVLPATEGIESGVMIPAAKIAFDANEFTLGRLIVRRMQVKDNETHVAFSTIDSRVPVDGSLSRYLKNDQKSKTGAYDFEMNPDKFNLATFKENSHTNIDLLQRTEQFGVFLKEWRESNKFQYYTVRTASKGERVNLKQRRKGERNDYLVASSNDYLGLACHPEVLEAAKKAIDRYGFGSTGSPVTTGLTDLHEELEHTIARLFKKQSAALFNSGYAANVGIINGLAGAQDLLIADILSHASIQDAMQMSKATSRFFLHNDMRHLKKIFNQNRSNSYGALVITDGVFSMDGDVAPLNKISELCRQNNTRLMVDEAHSFGVVGPTGLGAWEKYPDAQVDIIMGTFSKICGSIGGFVAASEEVVEWLRFYSRSYVFSVSLPPSSAAATLAALRVFRANPDLVYNLQRNISHFTKGLRDLACPIEANHESAVVPVIIGDEKKLGIMNETFRNDGIYVIPIIYPAVSRKQCRFRFTMMATHTPSDIDYILNVLEKAMIKANFSFKDMREEESAPQEGIQAA